MPQFVHVEAASRDETTILIEGLQRDITLLQITDSHMVEVDARDAMAIEHGTRLRDQFQSHSPAGWDPRLHLREAIARANELGVDCAVLTGDIMHFPSAASLEALEQELDALRAPYLYMCGNHDWQFPYLPATEATRAEYHPRFHRFTGGTPMSQAQDIHGVRLIALDNSTYQLDDTQLMFLRQQIATGLPCLLFMHIPIYTSALAPSVWTKWNAPIMLAAPDWTAELQQAWSVRDADESTIACHELLVDGGAPSVAAIFCGHVHFSHAAPFQDGQVQYVTRPGFEGGYRVIRLLRA
jgi:3',5'-cyclic AMP phosphodiesterase CpdA